MVNFAGTVKREIGLLDHFDVNALKNAIDSMVATGTGTKTYLGIEEMQKIFDLEGRNNIPRVGIVLTDGSSFDFQKTTNAAAAAKAKGTVMVAVGFGPDVNVEELKNIASDPDSKYVIQAKDAKDLANYLQNLAVYVCREY